MAFPIGATAPKGFSICKRIAKSPHRSCERLIATCAPGHGIRCILRSPGPPRSARGKTTRAASDHHRNQPSPARQSRQIVVQTNDNAEGNGDGAVDMHCSSVAPGCAQDQPRIWWIRLRLRFCQRIPVSDFTHLTFSYPTPDTHAQNLPPSVPYAHLLVEEAGQADGPRSIRP